MTARSKGSSGDSGTNVKTSRIAFPELARDAPMATGCASSCDWCRAAACQGKLNSFVFPDMVRLRQECFGMFWFVAVTRTLSPDN